MENKLFGITWNVYISKDVSEKCEDIEIQDVMKRKGKGQTRLYCVHFANLKNTEESNYMKITNVEKIYNLLNARIKVSRNPISPAGLMSYIRTINEINDLPEDVNFFQGVELKHYLIPDFLKGLILPDKVTHFAGRKWEDIRVRDNTELEDFHYVGDKGVQHTLRHDDAKILRHNDFNDVSIQILNAFRLKTEMLVSIDRSNQVFDEAMAERTVSSDGNVMNFGVVPIALQFNIDLAKASCYAYDAEESLLEYISVKLLAALN